MPLTRISLIQAWLWVVRADSSHYNSRITGTVWYRPDDCEFVKCFFRIKIFYCRSLPQLIEVLYPPPPPMVTILTCAAPTLDIIVSSNNQKYYKFVKWCFLSLCWYEQHWDRHRHHQLHHRRQLGQPVEDQGKWSQCLMFNFINDFSEPSPPQSFIRPSVRQNKWLENFTV